MPFSLFPVIFMTVCHDAVGFVGIKSMFLAGVSLLSWCCIFSDYVLPRFLGKGSIELFALPI